MRSQREPWIFLSMIFFIFSIHLFPTVYEWLQLFYIQYVNNRDYYSVKLIGYVEKKVFFIM